MKPTCRTGNVPVHETRPSPTQPLRHSARRVPRGVITHVDARADAQRHVVARFFTAREMPSPVRRVPTSTRWTSCLLKPFAAWELQGGLQDFMANVRTRTHDRE